MNETTDRTCGRPMRGDRKCLMDAGHRGRCASTVHGCDACGKTRRGARPFVEATDSNGDPDVAFCFMCCVMERDR